MPHIPNVSIGVPVFNGELFLAAAVESLLAQKYADFEIILCDNASTDGTGDICRHFAALDPRVRYHCNEQNIGPHPNFKLAFELARAPYFRWHAHDDLVDPEHLGRCVAALESTPGAVLAQSLVRIVDPDGIELGVYDSGLNGASSESPSRRFAALIFSRHLCTEMFGVMRSSALRQTALLRDYYGGDRALLAEMSLLGRIVQVPEPLFSNREHPGRGSRAVKPADHQTSAKEVRQNRAAPLMWNLWADYGRAVRQHIANPAERLRYRAYLLGWWFVDWNAARLAVDVVGLAYPGIYEFVNRLKLRFLGPMPQIGLRR